MKKQEYKLSSDINAINIDVCDCDISIHSDNIEQPTILASGKFDIYDKNGTTEIKQKKNNTSNSIIINGNNINYNSNVIICNGVKLSNYCFSSSGNDSLELIIPKKVKNLEIFIDGMSSDISIDDIIFSRLRIKTMSGDIVCRDIDLLSGNFHSMSGDIFLELLESSDRFRTDLRSMSGDIDQIFVPGSENISINISNEKRNLEANTMSGDIKVLFKGKRR